MFRSKRILFILTTLLYVSACGGQTQDPSIATAVALTVAAQNAAPSSTASPLPPTAFPTQTPLQFSPIPTSLTPIASPTLKGNASKSDCAHASLVSETIPDGTIFRPGEQFTKTWEIQNLSNCTWDTSYKIVFWDGDVLGGGYVYNLPQFVPPQGTVPISLVLTAPSTNGPYTSEWMLETPSGTFFGVGEYSASFFTKIVVSDAKKPGYAILSVDYKVVRDPAVGCPANVTYTVNATLTSNGPIEIKYAWIVGGPAEEYTEKPKTLVFKEAGSQTVSNETKLHLGNTPGNQRYKAINILDPYNERFPDVHFLYDCGDY